MPINPYSNNPNRRENRDPFALPAFPGHAADALYVSPNGRLLDQPSLERKNKLNEYIIQQSQLNLSNRIKTDFRWEETVFRTTGDLFRKASIIIADRAGNIQEAINIENASDLNSYFGNILGMFSAGFERTQHVIKHVRLDDKVTYLKLQSATRGLRYGGYLGNFFSLAMSFEQMRENNFSKESIVRFGVDGTITIIGLANPFGLPIGYTAALILGSMNSDGAFDNFYNKFSNDPLK